MQKCAFRFYYHHIKHHYELVVRNSVAMIDDFAGVDVAPTVALVPDNLTACRTFVFQTCGQADSLRINRVSVDCIHFDHPRILSSVIALA